MQRPHHVGALRGRRAAQGRRLRHDRDVLRPVVRPARPHRHVLRDAPDLERCFARYAKPQLRYAHSMLGDKEAAKAVVRRCYRHLALNWRNVQQEESPEAYAWKLLKQRVEIHLRLAGRPAPAQMVQSAAFQHTARATLEAALTSSPRWNPPSACTPR